MYPTYPIDMMAGSFEMLCCLFTIIAASISTLLTLRF